MVTGKAGQGTSESWFAEWPGSWAPHSGRRVTRTQFIYKQNKAARGTGLESQLLREAEAEGL